MKQTITIIIFLLSFIKTYGQSSTVGIIPNTMNVVLCTDNINLTTEYSRFGLYTMWDLEQVISQVDYRYNFPNTLGVNFAILQNGLNIGGGASIEWVSTTDYEIYPNVLIRLNHLKMVTQDNRHIDISLMLNVSKEINFGIGLSIPYRLNAL